MHCCRATLALAAAATAVALSPAGATAQTATAAGSIVVTDTRFVNPQDGGTLVTIYAGQSVEFSAALSAPRGRPARQSTLTTR